jgi:hypothetical protein
MDQLKPNQILQWKTLRNWISRFGHAYYESRADHEIKADEDNVHVFYNAISKYQRYVFIHIPLEESIELKACSSR